MPDSSVLISVHVWPLIFWTQFNDIGNESILADLIRRINRQQHFYGEKVFSEKAYFLRLPFTIIAILNHPKVVR